MDGTPDPSPRDPPAQRRPPRPLIDQPEWWDAARTPPAVRWAWPLRHDWRFRAAWFAAAVGVVLVINAKLGWPEWGHQLLFLAALPLAIWEAVLRGRIKRAVRDAEGTACTFCTYDMRGATPTAAGELICPECGRPFDAVNARRSWAKAGMWDTDKA